MEGEAMGDSVPGPTAFSRRKFLVQGAALSLPFLVPSEVLGKPRLPRNPRAFRGRMVREGLGDMNPIAGRSALCSTGMRRSHRVEVLIGRCQEAGCILGVQSATLGNPCRRRASLAGGSFRLIGLIRREMVASIKQSSCYIGR